MARNTPPIRPKDSLLRYALLVDSDSAGMTNSLIFNDGSIEYFGISIRQNFQYALIDNVGLGTVRISYNRPGIDMSLPTNGAKTLDAKDALYIEEEVWGIDIYYETASTVEIILKSDKE